jgi:hypothetical protein
MVGKAREAGPIGPAQWHAGLCPPYDAASSSVQPPPSSLLRERGGKRGSEVSRVPALARLARGCAAARPHLLEIIERTNFWPEDMNNHVAGVDQHPIAMGQALDPDAGKPSPMEALQHLIGDRPDMAIGPSGGHNHVIGDRGFGAQIDCGGVLSLHVVEAREDDAKRLIGVRTHL